MECICYLVYTSWHMLFAGLLYELELGCAWVYDSFVFVLRFYGPANQMRSCRARPVYLTTSLLGRLSLLCG